MLGNRVTLAHGEHGLPAGTIESTSPVGRSVLRRVPAAGITLRLEGDSNDYVGKGSRAVRSSSARRADATFDASQNVIAGNVIGYGATQGMFLRGVVGSASSCATPGATAVVEGVGDHALEYMTGGLAVILGRPGATSAPACRAAPPTSTSSTALVNREALASGELELLEMGSGDVEILRDLLNGT
jgi:glutamate synthase (NADPH/NADH) large chain